jgi:lipid-binding SYLF domain-containing protein
MGCDQRPPTKTIDTWGGHFVCGTRDSILVAFLTDQEVKKFRVSVRTDKSWQVGVDGSIALLNLGAQASIHSATINQPTMGFVFRQEGLMYDVSLQGSKITKLNR